MQEKNDKNALLFKKANEYLMFVANRKPVVFDWGKGAYLYDMEGKRYLDFIGGWAVTSLGHSPSCIIDALDRQSRKLITPSPSFVTGPAIDLAEMLVKQSCFEKVWFGSSGAEVNEAAIKFVRKYGSVHKDGAFEIITTNNSFHGRTITTMGASGKAQFTELFEPKTPGFKKVPFNDSAAIEGAVSDKTIAVMIEPIQGEGGVIVPDSNYYREIRDICDKNGLLLIFDEIQTGIGRTGTMFYYEQCAIEPDVMTIAKGIGGGFPLSAILVKNRHCTFTAGDHGGTYGGEPLATAVGLAVMREMLEKKIPQNAARVGEYLRGELEKIADEYGLSRIRGKGLLAGADISGDKGDAVVTECLKMGLLINSPRPSMIRFMPPLNIDTSEVDEMIAILKGAIQVCLGQGNRND